jgi:hypothetical protein
MSPGGPRGRSPPDRGGWPGTTRLGCCDQRLRRAAPRYRAGDLRPAARALDQSVAGADQRPGEAAGRPAAGVPCYPPDRHQRKDLDIADDRGAAAGAGAANRAVHQPALVVRRRADLRGRASARRRAIRDGLRGDQAVCGHRGRHSRGPAVLLRGHGGHGVRGVRRCAGRRLRARGRHGRHLGQHQCGRRRRGGGDAHFPRPYEVPGQHRGGDRRGQSRHHQARSRRGTRPAVPGCGPGTSAPGG